MRIPTDKLHPTEHLLNSRDRVERALNAIDRPAPKRDFIELPEAEEWHVSEKSGPWDKTASTAAKAGVSVPVPKH